jgi:phosphoribosylanthranilate isomerase
MDTLLKPAGLIKICGLSTAETLESALSAGADMVGLVYFAKSPRHVNIAQGQQLADQARGRAKIVALTVNADDALLESLIQFWQPDVIQCHGDESLERLSELRTFYSGQIMKVIGVKTANDLAEISLFAPLSDYILLDAKAPEGADLPGGNGITFDWSLLKGLKSDVPVLLSGGLTPENVAQAIHITRLAGVDVSSGVERSLGVKDDVKIKRFISQAREAFANGVVSR